MTEEFNLSNKVNDLTGFGTGFASPRFIHIDDVKEFQRIKKKKK